MLRLGTACVGLVLVVGAVNCGSNPGTGPPGLGGGSGGGAAASGASGGTGGGGSGGTSGSGGQTSATCLAYCVTGHSLGCANDPSDDAACSATCDAYRTSTPSCVAQADAWLKCVAGDPNNFYCDDDGEPSLDNVGSTGACKSLYLKTLACWCASEGTNPKPDVQATQAACEQVCANTASLACAEPQCQQKCQTLGPDAFAFPVYAVTKPCQATLPASNYECSAEGKLQLKQEFAFTCYQGLAAALACGFLKIGVCGFGADCQAECADSLCTDETISASCRACLDAKVLTTP